MAKLDTIYVDFDGRVANLNRKMQALETRSQTAANRMQKAFSRSFNAIGAALAATFSVRAISSIASDSVKLAREQEKAEAKVEQAVKSTGKAAGFTADELKRLAAERQKQTGIGDEKILNEVTAQLLTFTNITNDNFVRTQNVVLDLATVLDGDLKSSAIQLGKALNDPVANLSALSRSGIQFTKEQKKVINELVASNRLFDAQTIILDELQRQYGGQAEKQAETERGLKQMVAAVGDAQEKIGLWILNGIQPAYEGIETLAANIGEFFQRLSENDLETATRQLKAFGIEAEKIAKLTALNVVLETRKELGKMQEQLEWFPINSGFERIKGLIFESKEELKGFESVMKTLISDSTTYEEKQKLLEEAAARAGVELNRMAESALTSGNTEALEDRTEQLTKQSNLLNELSVQLIKQEDLKNELTAAQKILSGEEIKAAEKNIQNLRDEANATENNKKQSSSAFEKLKFLSAEYYGFRIDQIKLEAEEIAKATGDYIAAEIWKYKELRGLVSEYKEWYEINIKPTFRPEPSTPESLPFILPPSKPVVQDTTGLKETLELQDLINQGFQAMGYAASAAASQFSVFENANSILEQMIDAFARAVLQALILKTVLGLFGLGGGFEGISLFGGIAGKAAGGDVQKGKPYIVGEKGAELFIPNEKGMIVPNNVMNNITRINTDYGFNDTGIVSAINRLRTEFNGRLEAYNINTMSAMGNIPPIVINLDGRNIAKVTQKKLNTMEREGVNKKAI